MKLYDITNIKYDYSKTGYKDREPQGEFIAEIPDELFEIGGKHYLIGDKAYFACIANREAGFAECRSYDPEDVCDTDCYEEEVCPVCKRPIQDLFEMEEGDTFCPNCGADINIERQVIVTYSITLVKKPEMVEIKPQEN